MTIADFIDWLGFGLGSFFSFSFLVLFLLFYV